VGRTVQCGACSTWQDVPETAQEFRCYNCGRATSLAGVPIVGVPKRPNVALIVALVIGGLLLLGVSVWAFLRGYFEAGGTF
jgi:hypothetical protein